MSTWETFHTHTLFLGYVNGPTEGLLVATCMIMASGIWGPQIYEHRAVETFGHPGLFGEATFQDVFVFVLGASFVLGHAPGCLYNVAKARRRQNLPIGPVLSQLTPMLAVTTATVAWLWSPNSFILSNDHLILFAITMSFVFGRMTTKIILAHLTKQEFPWWTILAVPLYIGAVLVNLPTIGLPAISASLELFYLRSYLVFAFCAYMYWALFTINRITTYLGIGCLTIKQDKSRARDQVYRNFGEPSTGSVDTIQPSHGLLPSLPEHDADVRLKNH